MKTINVKFKSIEFFFKKYAQEQLVNGALRPEPQMATIDDLIISKDCGIRVGDKILLTTGDKTHLTRVLVKVTEEYIVMNNDDISNIIQRTEKEPTVMPIKRQ